MKNTNALNYQGAFTCTKILKKGNSKMKNVNILWKGVSYPIGLGRLIDVRNDETAYSLGDFPGIIIYSGNERTLKYYDLSSKPDISTIKRILGIISLFLNKLPSEISLPT